MTHTTHEYGVGIKLGTRVEISPHYDLWMMGARYGTVTNHIANVPQVTVRLDAINRTLTFPIADLKAV